MDLDLDLKEVKEKLLKETNWYNNYKKVNNNN